MAAMVALQATASPLRVGAYDFNYRVTGDPAVKPVQVFDDGANHTFFQFSGRSDVPLILEWPEGRMVVPRTDGPYHVVSGLKRNYRLVFQGRQALAVHSSMGEHTATLAEHILGAEAARAAGASAAETATATADGSSHALPAAGDSVRIAGRPQQMEFTVEGAADGTVSAAVRQQIRHAAQRLLPDGWVRVFQRDDSPVSTRLASSVRDSLVAAGVGPSDVTIHLDPLAPLAPAGSGTQWPGARVLLQAPGGSVSSVDSPRSGSTLGAGALRNAERWASGRAWTSARAPAPGLSPASGIATVPSAAASDPQPPSAVVTGLDEAEPARAGRDGMQPSAQATGRPLATNFDLLMADGTVSAALRRWAVASGYRLEWQTPLDAPITGELTLPARAFPEALSQVLGGLGAAGYRLQAEASGPRAVRITQLP